MGSKWTEIAKHIAKRCACDTVMDAFCGVGGNAIQLALTCKKVIAIELDPVRLDMAKHNAKVYGVQDKIEFVLGDYFEVGHTYQVDGVFLSPPWGGPEYIHADAYALEHVQPKCGEELVAYSRRISPNVCLYLPRNVEVQQLRKLVTAEETMDIEQNLVQGKIKTVCVYFGNFKR